VDISNYANGVVTGPGGTLTDASLDNGNSSRHGYADINSLPAGTTVILNAGDASQAVVFSYKYGTGYVIYSSIPIDFYLDGSDTSDFSQLYAPNIFQYGVDLFTGK
jgi:large repetitive protein